MSVQRDWRVRAHDSRPVYGPITEFQHHQREFYRQVWGPRILRMYHRPGFWGGHVKVTAQP